MSTYVKLRLKWGHFRKRVFGLGWRVKVTLPLIPDFYQKSLRTKIRLKILELNSRKKHFDPHSSSRGENFSKTLFFQNFFDFPGYGRASERVIERNAEFV